MEFSVSLYSFASELRKGALSPVECISAAKDLGFDAVEAVDFINFDCPLEEREAKALELKEAADRCGLKISSLAVGADFLNGCGGDTAQEIQRVKGWVEIAALLGAPKMRHDITQGYSRDSGKYQSYESLLPALATAVREVADYAAARGVMTMTENHGFFSQDSQRVEALYNAVGHPNFGLLCDMGNFLCADEDPAQAVAKVAPYTRYAHAKDFIYKPFYGENPGEGSFQTRGGNFLRGTIIGQGNVPVKQCLHLLKAAGFDGTIAVEFEGLEPALDGLRIGLNNLKQYWSEV